MLAVLAIGHQARAISVSKGISVGPFLQQITLAGDQEEATFSIEVTNSSAATQTLELSVIDFGAADESGSVAFFESGSRFEQKYNLASYIKLEKDRLVIAPNSSQKVEVTITNHESLSPGGHYGAVIFKVENALGTGDSQPKVNLTQALSSLIFVNKAGGERYSLNLNNYNFTGPWLDLPREVKLRFLNNGNVHVTPYGDITIRDPLGRTVARSAINPQSTLILPETFRQYISKIAEISPVWVPGWYSLELRYRYDNVSPFTIVKSGTLVLLPRLVLLTLIALVLSLILGWWHRRRVRTLLRTARRRLVRLFRRLRRSRR